MTEKIVVTESKLKVWGRRIFNTGMFIVMVSIGGMLCTGVIQKINLNPTTETFCRKLIECNNITDCAADFDVGAIIVLKYRCVIHMDSSSYIFYVEELKPDPFRYSTVKLELSNQQGYYYINGVDFDGKLSPEFAEKFIVHFKDIILDRAICSKIL